MRKPVSAPSLVPLFDVTEYLVLDDFGQVGQAYRETDENAAELEHVIEAMLSGQYNKPVRVVAFNTAEGWARDVSEEIAWEVLKRTAAEGRRLPESTQACPLHFLRQWRGSAQGDRYGMGAHLGLRHRDGGPGTASAE